MTVLFVLISALFYGLVHTLESLLHFTDWPQRLLLTLVANLPWLLFTVLSVAVLLSFLRSSFHLELANLLGFEMAVLFFDGEREDIGELLTVTVNIGFAHLNLNLSGNVVAILRRLPRAHDTLGSIAIVLGALVPLTVKLNGIRTGDVVYDLLFHVTVWCFNICTLIVVLSGHVDLVGSVANSILTSETSLDLIGFFQGLIMDGLNQIADQLIHIEANSFYVGLNNPRTVVIENRFTMFLILGPASSFGPGDASFATDYNRIHEEHDVLFANILAVSQQPDDASKLKTLKDNMKQHFLYEEGHFCSVEDFNCVDHRMKHYSFWVILENQQVPVGCEEINWAKNWLAQHIKNTDHQYKQRLTVPEGETGVFTMEDADYPTVVAKP